MSKYVYTAVFTPEEEGGYSARFPDLQGCYTQGEDLADALEMAKDVLTLMLVVYEDDGTEIPLSTNQEEIKVEKGEFTSLVSADTMEYRRFYDNKAVKKTLTIPKWLNTMAEKKEINFSAILQKALKEELKIAE